MRIGDLLIYIIDILFPRNENVLLLEEITKAELLRRKCPTITPSIVTIFSYKDPVIRGMIWELKYKKNVRIARLFAEVVADEVVKIHEEMMENGRIPRGSASGASPGARTSTLILPLPNSRNRKKERGFNQCELITKELAHLISLLTFSIHTDLLIKWKDTPRQTTGNRAVRLSNIKGCFKMSDPDFIKNKNIILIDDVVTTESTMKEAIATLYSAGARKVIGLAIAHS